MKKKKKKIAKRRKQCQQLPKSGQASSEVRVDLTYDDAIARIDCLAANEGVSRDEYVNGVAFDTYEPPDDVSCIICDMLFRGESFETISIFISGSSNTGDGIFV